MSQNSTPKFSVALTLYIAVGIVIFISIAYTVANKPPKTVSNETTTAATPVVTDAATKEKNDQDVTLALEKRAAENPTVDNYINLAYVYYNTKRYPECIAMNRKAIALNPNLSLAYNNICSAYNSMSKWDSAAMACTMALKIQPDFALAKNNLDWTNKMIKEGK